MYIQISVIEGALIRETGGRHNKLQPSDKRAILNSIRVNPQLSCDDLKARLHLKSSAQTIRRYLKKQGYRYRLPQKELKLTKKTKPKESGGLGNLKTTISPKLFLPMSAVYGWVG